MPDSRRDWRKQAQRTLADSPLSADEREEIARELAGYLEDLCGDALGRGFDDSAAARTAAAELHEDKHLGANLYRARKESPMSLNDRTKRLWFPSLSMLVAAAATLAISQVAASWAYGGYAPTAHGNDLATLLANFRRHNAAALMIYLAWLYTLPFLSAIGAWWSRRVGSGRAMQIASGISPLLLLLAAFCGQYDVGHEGTSLFFLAMDALPPAHIFFPVLSSSASLLLSWVVIPGAALLLGIIPFLFTGETRQVSAAPAERASI